MQARIGSGIAKTIPCDCGARKLLTTTANLVDDLSEMGIERGGARGEWPDQSEGVRNLGMETHWIAQWNTM